MIYALEYIWFKIQIDKKWQSWIKWMGSFFVTLSGLAVTLSPEVALQPHVFFTFLVGHITWSVLAFRMKEWALLYLNVFFCIIDIIGITIRL